MTALDKQLDIYVTSFDNSDQYKTIEQVFDSFGGSFTVKSEDGRHHIYSDSIGRDFYEIMLVHNSVIFRI